MTISHRARIAALMLPLTVQAGCHTTRRTSPGALVPDADIHVAFARPQPLVLAQPGTADIVLADVVQLHGRAVAVVGDTIRVHVVAAKDAAGRELVAPAAGTTSFTRKAAARIEVRRFDTGKTAGLLGGVALGLAVVYALVLYVAFTTGWGT